MNPLERLPSSPVDTQRAAAFQFLLEREVLYARKTHRWYKQSLDDFHRFAGEVEPHQLSRSLILSWVKDLQGRVGPVSVNNRFRAIRAYCNWLVAEGFIETSPLVGVRPPRMPKTLIPTFTPEQVEAMMALCPPNVRWGARDGAIIQLLLRTGIRLEGLVGMSDGDIDLEHRLLVVTEKGDKQRSIWLDGMVVRWLLRYSRFRKSGESAWWQATRGGKPLTDNGVEQIINRVGRCAGIKGVRCSPHTFRHTFAVSYLRAGGDVRHLQEIMGHTSLKALEGYLRMINAEDAIQQHRKVDPFKGWGEL